MTTAIQNTTQTSEKHLGIQSLFPPPLHSSFGPCGGRDVLSSPPSGTIQTASIAAGGRSVFAAPGSNSEAVNYSSKQRSHREMAVLEYTGVLQKAGTQHGTSATRLPTEQIRRSTLGRDRFQLAFPPLSPSVGSPSAVLGVEECKIFFTPAAWKTAPLQPLKHTRFHGRIHPNPRRLFPYIYTQKCEHYPHGVRAVALAWIARAAAPRAALLHLREGEKNGLTSVLARGVRRALVPERAGRVIVRTYHRRLCDYVEVSGRLKAFLIL